MKAKCGDTIIENDDLIDFNKAISEYPHSEVEFIEAKLFNNLIKIDLVNQTISINNELVNLDCPRLDNVRWINFRRNYIVMSMDGQKTRTHKIGMGFQGNYNGENLQRFILIDAEGYNLEVKK
jgi:hypothetical protein